MRINFLCYLLSVSFLFMEDNFFRFFPLFFVTPFLSLISPRRKYIMQRLNKDFSKQKSVGTPTFGLYQNFCSFWKRKNTFVGLGKRVRKRSKWQKKMSLEIDIREPKVQRYTFNQPFFSYRKEKIDLSFSPHLTSRVKYGVC